MLPTSCPPTIWAIPLESHRKLSILAADDFLGACYRKAMTPKKLWTLLFPPKKGSENTGANEIFWVGSQQFRESLRELLWELWFSHCSSREKPFPEWDFSLRELYELIFRNSESCSENTPELSQSSENGLFTPRAFFLKLGWSPGFWITAGAA